MQKTHPDHHYYIIGLRKNDTKIVEEIYKKYHRENILWVMRNKGTRQEGEDVFQEALIVLVHKSRDENFFLPCPFGAYLRGICRFLWFRISGKKIRHEIMVRNENLKDTMSKEEFEKIIEEAVDGHICRKFKERTFSQLSKLCQKLLTLYLEEESVANISQKLDMTDNAIYRRRFACLKTWGKKMRADPDFKHCKPF